MNKRLVKGWTAHARGLDNPPDYTPLPIEKIHDYHFQNEYGTVFRIRLEQDGRLKISIDENLILSPEASNGIFVAEKMHL